MTIHLPESATVVTRFVHRGWQYTAAPWAEYDTPSGFITRSTDGVAKRIAKLLADDPKLRCEIKQVDLSDPFVQPAMQRTWKPQWFVDGVPDGVTEIVVFTKRDPDEGAQ